MLKSLFPIALIFLLAAPNMGQEVKDQSTWTSGGTSITVDVDDNPTAGEVSVTFSDSAGSSSCTRGTPGANSTSTNPTCSQSAEATTPGGADVRIKDGKVQIKTKRGKWIDMRHKSRKRGTTHSGMQNPGPWRPNGGGEEVTSLPH